jgi:nicotinate-nucleotide pyrophosphorylase
VSVYRITGFDEGPHWHIALIEAETPEQAKELLKDHVDALVAADEKPDTVWSWGEYQSDEWRVVEVSGSILLVLGAGCR